MRIWRDTKSTDGLLRFHRQAALLVALLSLPSCQLWSRMESVEKADTEPGASGSIPNRTVLAANFEAQPLPDLSRLDLPRADDGSLVLQRGSEVEVRYDPRQPPNPMTARVACAEWLLQCIEATARDVDGCVEQVRTCSTAEPWNEGQVCCPAECQDQYASARARGENVSAAWLSVFTGAVSCIPQYGEWVNGASR